MSGAAPKKNGSLTILSTMVEVRDASLRVANSANRVLSIFTHDLEPQIYGEELFLESVKRLVLARAYAKVRVLIVDPVPRGGGQKPIHGHGAPAHQLH
jgi:hypothetical protein